MPLTLYIATSNPGKLRDFAHAAANQEDQTGTVTILPVSNLSSIPEPIEDAPTFEGNACIKALAYSVLAPDQIVLADDSGIELDALAGAPGVRSARFAEDENFPATPGQTKDDRNNQALQARAAHLTGVQRRARYRCVIAAARNGEIIANGTGSLEGILLESPQGKEGFGYDPYFLVPETNQTMAELDPATRLTLSHRGRALRDLLPKLPH
ncbi:non-canonical purine NTP pyrophosphatase [Granulicella tundricola]|uniref:Nucleoside-triphosphatase n=1 Tax=Granulicella tundricola (strain ATCC BAA-1859 / DSM 23138 / MP5ACTX9) TaxID=1198114 RepID=E8WVK1_GRATM|nr:non-canonical purine NTP pyrophosphatase [Granulicella tundricola]ADW68449.1 Nucleoside-triphosphatase [Granulicella tundricola MP5ACTX9]